MRERARRMVAAQAMPSSLLADQVRMLGASSVVVMAVLAVSDTVDPTTWPFLLGLAGLPLVTAVTAVVPWGALDRRWQVAVPLADLLVVALFRLAAPDAGFGVLLVLPVLWLGLSFGRVGALVGGLAAPVVLVAQTALAHVPAVAREVPPPPGAPSLSSLVLTMVLVAGFAYLADRRLRAQATLLSRQAQWVEDSLDRATVEEQTLREVVNAATFVVIAFDGRGQVTDTNRAARQLLDDLGIPLSTPFDRLPAYRADATTPVGPDEAPHRLALAGAPVEEQLFWLGHVDGPRRAVELSATRQLRADGSLGRVLLIGRDVTAEIEESQARDDTLASISHEFRTPLNSILGYLDLAQEDLELGDPTAASRVEHNVGVAIRNTERLVALVEDLIALRSRGARSEIDIQRGEVDLAALVEESVEVVVPLARQRIVSVGTELEPVAVWGDGFRLRQVVDNLVSNAVKYNRAGGRVRVSVGTDVAGRGTVTVRDTGIGMSESDRTRIFEPFFRTATARSSDTPGTGLGLSVSAEIVALHDGTITVDSLPGVGTTVVVTLPAAVSTPAPDHAAHEPGPGLTVVPDPDEPGGAVPDGTPHVRDVVAPTDPGPEPGPPDPRAPGEVAS